MDTSNLNKNNIFNPKVIKKGIILFLSITLITFAVIYIYNDGLENLSYWKNLSWPFLLLGLVFIFNDLYIGGLRNHVFIREFVPGISQMVSIKANLANIFMGAMTPSQSGGGPAQWYIFYRNGVSLPDIIGASFYNWISTLIFFPITGFISLVILNNNIPEGFVTHLTAFGFGVFATLLVLVMLGLFAPHIIKGLISGLALTLGVCSAKLKEKILFLGEKGITQLENYRSKYISLILRKPQLMIMSFLLTIVLYFNKYALAYIFIIAFGVKANFYNVMAVMSVSYLLLYFAPSPGGSGLAEVGITALLSPVIGQELAPTITLLHRSFMVFIPAILGVFVVIVQMKKE